MATSKSEQLMVADIMCIIRDCINCEYNAKHGRCKTDCYHIVVAQIEEIVEQGKPASYERIYID